MQRPWSPSRKTLWPTLLALGLALVTVRDGAAQSPLLDTFMGSWTGTGLLFGQDSEFSMTWEPALDGRLVRLTFRNSRIQAEAFYGPAESGDYLGTWADSRGVIQPLSAVVKDSVLETSWGSPDTEQGRTRYRLLGLDKIEVTDSVLRDGDWVEFGRASYSRQTSKLESVQWLLGVWTRETEEVITEESWTKLGGSVLEGNSVSVSKASGDTVFTESLLLAEMQGDVYYLPQPSGNPFPVAFKLVARDSHRLVFENPDHDFPQRIVYELENSDVLVATISGTTDDGERSVAFRFSRR